MGGPIYEFGTFSLDVAEHRLSHNGEPVPLMPRVFDLLRVLVEHAGHLVEKEQLLKEVWNDACVEEANLNRGISVLRKALHDTPTMRYIETVPKRGYRFVAPVRPRYIDAPTAVERIPRRLGSTTSGFIAVALVMTVAYLTYLALGRGEPGAAGASIHRQLTFTGREVTPTLSPDGSRIAYVSAESPNRRVMVQDIDGGQPTSVFSAPEANALRWSPDGSELLFWARGAGTDGVYIAPCAPGAARKVADSWAVTCWSPDGSVIAVALFVAQKIRFIDRLGKHERTISLQGTTDWIWDLDWSATHNRILFVTADDQRRAAIWSIRPDGTGQTKILSMNGEISAARWAPSGDAIYYVARVNQTASLFKAVIPPDFGAAQQPAAPLISGLEADGSFGLSSKADRFVYARAPYYANLWLVETDPTSTKPARTTQLTRGTSVAERPRVSPDGRTILFNMGYESRTNLFTMPAAGGSPKQLTFLNAFSVGGVWSPDGGSVAFASTEGGQPRVWVVKADGSSPHPLPTGDMSENFNLAWAPGARLLYQKAGYQNFYAIDPATRHQQLLLQDGPAAFVSSTEYSPDGKSIVMIRAGPPRSGLWMIDSGGSGATLIHAVTTRSDFQPVPIGWSPDRTAVYGYHGKRAAARGQSVLFGETVTEARIATVPVNSGPPTTIVNLPFDETGGVAMFADGRRFVVSVYSSRSDVWVVENFDAGPPASIARRLK